VSDSERNEQRINQLIGLIKEISYDKSVDEFKLTECVICFEDFQSGVPIRKIPICRHIFHTKCIDGWFRAKIQESTHKCPLCNCDINIENVRNALRKGKDGEEEKKGSRSKVNKVAPMLPSVTFTTATIPNNRGAQPASVAVRSSLQFRGTQNIA
jgi:hypothetical protein